MCETRQIPAAPRLRFWRSVLGATLVASFLAAAAACGGSTEVGTSTTSVEPPTTSAATTTTPAESATSTETTTASSDEVAVFPREVEHALGTTVVPAEPTRIVTVGVTEQDAALALGIAPVGVTEWYGEQPFATWPWAQDELGDATPEVLSTVDGFDFERIAALDPDLIIGTNAGLDEKTYRLLSDIAPTLAHPFGSEPYFSPWADQAELIAEAIGKETEMATIIDGIRQQFADAAAAHPEFAGKRIVFLQNALHNGEAIAYQDGLSTEFLTDLGFTIPAELDAFVREGEQAFIPMERLSVLDAADVLLWATEKPEDRTALEAEPLYRGLEEVEQGRLVFTDGVTAGAIYFTSVLSLPYVLDELVPALASTLDGGGPAVIESS